MDIHRQLEASQKRRMASEARMLDRLERRETAADKQIGELMREGKTVYYVWPQGGRYREGTRTELIGFLLRNNYA
ncbi:hypothetical protein [Alcaligenes faecalis]|uniref:hypothetical protein n=1 Tax=Alcaligenes faecalis TaxID=511 RepID=UPI0034D71B7E